MDFATKIKELEQELSKANDYKTLQEKATNLRRELNSSAPSLTSYEKEHFSNDIESILKCINAELSKSKGNKRRAFSFKQKTLPTTVQEKTKHKALVTTPEKTSVLKKNYVLKKGDSAFENLEYCTVASARDHSSVDAASGSLYFRNVIKSVINLQRIYFQAGSIFITDCKDSIFFLHLPSEGNIQIRLRNLQKCRILIERLSSDTDYKQVVIVENCCECIFKASTREHLIIQDFSNPFSSDETKDQSAFSFEDFKTYDNDTMQLLQAYL
ncbi:SMKI06G3485 [Saccharomyces mikatae IFO 1815]|uniref:SMKI06G3485 protein n=1 Tax=Saccharomyces mikatae IFO 1815 TaxID=226126 RepID=A0AA35J099_SACMI|nr:uncharacterized protein SMKI_06G3485 [Saccharomyces mikatae IFO 1815]CAI4038996.1 SMKI06G3485 [Saccharomyces mikatae IFO 1815]